MRRKMTMLLLAVLLLCSISLQVFGSELSISQPGEVKKGSTFTFEIRLPQTVRTKSGGIRLQYDTDKLTVTESQWKLTDPFIQSFDPANGVGVFAYQEAVELKGVIFTAKVTVKDSAPYGDAGFRVEVKFKNSDAPQEDRTFENEYCQLYVSCMDHQPDSFGGKCTVCGKSLGNNLIDQAPQEEPSATTQPVSPTATQPEEKPPLSGETAGGDETPEASADVPAATESEFTKPPKSTDPTQAQEEIITIGANEPREKEFPVGLIAGIVGGVLLLAGGILVLYLRGHRGGKFANKKGNRRKR